MLEVDGTIKNGGVTLPSQTEEIEQTFDAHDRQGLTSRALQAFALAASLAGKVRSYFGAPRR